MRSLLYHAAVVVACAAVALPRWDATPAVVAPASAAGGGAGVVSVASAAFRRCVGAFALDV